MKTPLCVVSSDWHLERHAWVRHPDLSGDSYCSLAQIVKICLDRDLPLIAAGDLFDKPYPDSRSVHVAMSQMALMQSARLPVLYTQGQHEKSKDQPWLGLSDWPTHLHNNTVNLNGRLYAGLDYTRPNDLTEAIRSATKGCDIFVCHQVWKNFMGQYCQSDGSLEDIPMSNGVIITGDFHKHINTTVNGNTVLSPGSICLQSVDEPPDKYVFILYDDMSTESVLLKTRKVFHHVLSTAQDLDDFLSGLGHGELDHQEHVPLEIAKNILNVRYNPDIPDVYAKVSTGVGTNAHLFLRPIAREIDQRTVEVGKANEVIELGLEGNLSKLCNPGSTTYVIAKRLLNSPDAKSELRIIEEEYLGKKEENE